MREEECSGINCTEESYGAGGWLFRTLSGTELPAHPIAGGIDVGYYSQASQVGAERRR